MEAVEFGEGSRSEVPGILSCNGTGAVTRGTENAVGIHFELLHRGRIHAVAPFQEWHRVVEKLVL